MTNPNDAIRDAVLRELYDVHKNARSPKSTTIKITDLQKKLRPIGYKQQDVASNLDYLVQKGWVKEVKTERSFTTDGGTVRSAEQITYKISDVGIDNLEGASVYKRGVVESNINITTIKGVTIVGDGNIINTEYSDLSDALTELRQAILDSTEILEQTKLETISDIDSLQSQLQKPEPNKSVIKSLWSGIKATVTASGFAEVVSKIAKFLSPLL